MTRLTHALQLRRSRTYGQYHRLEALDPNGVLRRGYAAVSRVDGTALHGLDDLHEGEELITRFAEGTVQSLVLGVDRSDGHGA